MNIEVPEQPKLASHDASILDLAFVMDCTGSMGSYIENARNVCMMQLLTIIMID